MKIPVIGIGASAGGIEAFEQFFSELSEQIQAAVVIVQHLDPNHESILDQIVRKYTRLPVHKIRNGLELKVGQVYILPANQQLVLRENTLFLSDHLVAQQKATVIDHFFHCLRAELAENAIGVILSGNGNDGTRGILAIKAAGGLTLVQDPNSAKADGMPRNAIGAGLIDHVLAPAEMPARIQDYLHFLQQNRQDNSLMEIPSRDGWLERIYHLILEHKGHDFSGYKVSTIGRRLARRIHITKTRDLQRYYAYLQENPEEIDLLYKEVLIGVTNFFRNFETFSYIEEKVIPDLVEHAAEGKIRIWVPGCATGEEAYTWAILVTKYLRAHQLDLTFQVFGSDIDNEALEKAREGYYGTYIEEDLSPELLSLFFIRENGGYRVVKSIREKIIFASHNLLQDPPYSHISLVSCRNLLIYFNKEMQQHAFSIINFALNENGLMVLGIAETLGEAEKYFKEINKNHKIYRKTSSIPFANRLYHYPQTFFQTRQNRIRHSNRSAIKEITQEILLDKFSPPSVMIDGDNNILYVQGKLGKYLEWSTGQVTNNIINAAREGLKIPLSNAIRRARENKHEVKLDYLRVKVEEGYQRIDLLVSPVDENAYGQPLLLIVFNKSGQNNYGALSEEPSSHTELTVAEMERELIATQEHLSSTISLLETTNLELKDANEDAQSANEELRSTNEELETSKEELQSLNEELNTTNQELEYKIIELNKLNNDISNLLTSTRIATIFLDQELRIFRFTPAVLDLMDLQEVDLGRPVGHFNHRLEQVDLVKIARQVLDQLTPFKTEIRTLDGHYYWMRALPYRTAEDLIQGVVFTFTDINEKKKQEAEIQHYQQHLEKMVEERTSELKQNREFLERTGEMARVGGWELNLNNRKVYWTRVTRLIHEVPDDKEYELEEAISFFPGEAGELIREKVEKAISQDEGFDVEVPFVSFRKNKLWVRAIGYPVFEGGRCIRLYGTFQDVTSQKESQLELARREKILSRTESIANIGSWEYNIETDQVVWSEELFRIFGLDPELGAPPFKEQAHLFATESLDRLTKAVEKTVKNGEPYELELKILRQDGAQRICISRGYPILEENAKITRLYGSFQDVTERELNRQKQLDAEERYRLTFDISPDAIIITKLDSTIIEVNRSFEQLSGYKAEEVIGKTSIELDIWSNLSQREYVVNQLNEHGVINNFELVYKKKNGEQQVALLSASLLMLKDEPYILSVTRDISERKQVENELKENKERLEAIFNFSENAILIADDLGKYVSVNPSAASMLGFRHDELQQMKVAEIVARMENATTFGYDTFIENGKEKGEFTFNRPDGSKRFIIYNAVRIAENLNFSIMNDITDRKLAEEQIRRNYDFIVNLTDQAPGTLFQCTADKSFQDFQWNYLSAASRLMYELDFVDLQTNPWAILEKIHPDDRDNFKNAFQDSFKNLSKITHEHRVSVNGRQIWVIARANPTLLPDGGVTWYGYLQDVSERVKSRQRIQESETIFRAITELSPVGITIIDQNTRILFVNPAIEKISGYRQDELIGNKIRGIHHENQPYIFELLDNLINERINGMDEEVRMQQKNGELIWVRVLGTRYPGFNNDKPYSVLLLVQDITYQKVTEDALRESKLQLENIADSVPGLVLRYEMKKDQSEYIHFVSKGVSNIYEVSQDEAKENVQLLWNRIHPDDVEYCRQAFVDSARDFNNVELEHRLLFPDGTIKWLSILAKPQRLQDGGVLWDMLGLDVTPQKKVQDDLMESERLSNAIASSMPAYLYVYDIELQKNIWTNKAHRQYFGHLAGKSSESLQLEDVSDLIHPDDFQRVIEITLTLHQNPDLEPHELEIRVKEGDGWRWMNLIIATFIKNNSGMAKQIIGALFDIQERKQIEAALQESEEKYRFIVEKTSDLISLMDVEGNYMFFSENVQGFTGYTKEQYHEIPLLEIVHPDDKEHIENSLNALLQNKIDELVTEYRLKKMSGEYIWLSSRSKVIKDEQGKFLFLLSNCSDITDRKRYEEELIEARVKAEQIKEELRLQNEKFLFQNEELKKANLELDNFVYRVSHDLRAPITSALGLTQLNMISSDLDEIHMHHQLQMKSLRKLDNFIQDILNFTRNSRLEVIPEMIDFNELVDEAIMENSAQVEEGNITINKQIINDQAFKTDRFRLQIIFKNLISNAVKYQNPQMSDPRVVIEVLTTPEKALIKVEDNGIGIDVTHYDKIFNMFYRATDRAPGSGLGLYIVKDCLERIGGTISFRSSVGKGTTFEIRLNNLQN